MLQRYGPGNHAGRPGATVAPKQVPTAAQTDFSNLFVELLYLLRRGCLGPGPPTYSVAPVGFAPPVLFTLVFGIPEPRLFPASGGLILDFPGLPGL